MCSLAHSSHHIKINPGKTHTHTKTKHIRFRFRFRFTTRSYIRSQECEYQSLIDPVLLFTFTHSYTEALPHLLTYLLALIDSSKKMDGSRSEVRKKHSNQSCPDLSFSSIRLGTWSFPITAERPHFFSVFWVYLVQTIPNFRHMVEPA